MALRGIVLGLGNPGPEYEPTRHNVGFRVVDELARRREVRPRSSRDLRSWVAEVQTCSGLVVLAKPKTFMNRSGSAALALLRCWDATAEDLLVVHDDADLALGRIRVRRSGSAGGHNGLRSLMSVLGSGEFPRVKLGVRGEERDAAELADYVLEPFLRGEEPTVGAMIERAADAVEWVLDRGVSDAMNRYNAAPAEDAGER